MKYLLVLYYSRSGATAQLATHIARGITGEGTFEARLRTVPDVATEVEVTAPPVPEAGAVYCTKEDLAGCSGLALGSPTRFGNMAAPLKHFLDSTADLWMQNRLEGIPAGVFCSSTSMHGGQESTLLSMMLPLMHHGMIITGLPYSNPQLAATKTGGTPYGATHVSGYPPAQKLSDEEGELAIAFGHRLATVAKKLHAE